MHFFQCPVIVLNKCAVQGQRGKRRCEGWGSLQPKAMCLKSVINAGLMNVSERHHFISTPHGSEGGSTSFLVFTLCAVSCHILYEFLWYYYRYCWVTLWKECCIFIFTELRHTYYYKLHVQIQEKKKKKIKITSCQLCAVKGFVFIHNELVRAYK